MRDLLGSKKPPDQLPEPWANLEFKYQGVPHLVWLVAMRPLDETGKVQDCHGCEPQLAAVTYKQEATGWSLTAVDSNLGTFGAYGQAPAKQKFTELPFGASAAIAFEDGGSGQGYTEIVQGVLSFDGNWKFLGFVPVGGDNQGTADCDEDKAKCWSWTGTLNVAATTSNGYPDLVVEKQGTVSNDNDAIVKAAPETYAFSGSKYEEKAKVEAAAAAAAARAAATVSVSELRRLAATGMKTYKPYWVSTMINGYDNLGDQLCDSVRYDGYCDPNRDSVPVQQDLPSTDVRRALYDARGRQGTALCAKVEMRPDGQVYLTEFSRGSCR